MGEPIVQKKNAEHISFQSNRRFGIELELNAFDGRNRPDGRDRPLGIEHVAEIVANAVPEVGSEIRPWEHSHRIVKWHIKPDASCGMEVVSPPLKGWAGLKDCLSVVKGLRDDEKVKADQRCSVHVHIDVSDLSETQVANVIRWWIKSEAVILDAMPLERKRNRYCQFIGMNNMFQHNVDYSDKDVIQRCGDLKYYSVNAYWYVNGGDGRRTIEFRTIEAAGCKDPYLVKNWVRFLVHFVERTATLKNPGPYREPKTDKERYEVTPWTSLVWLDPSHVLTLLGFNNVPCRIPGQKVAKEYTLSNGMQQTRNWFICRLMNFMSKHTKGGLRYRAALELEEIVHRYKEQGLTLNPAEHLSPTELDECVFGDDFRF